MNKLPLFKLEMHKQRAFNFNSDYYFNTYNNFHNILIYHCRKLVVTDFVGGFGTPSAGYKNFKGKWNRGPQ